MVHNPKDLLFSCIGRRTVYRIGRTLYQHARGDVANDMRSNGEMLIQRCVLGAWLKEGTPKNRLVVFDVGANVGDWSAAFLRRVSDSSLREFVDLYAFEPVPATAKTLRRNLGDQNPFLHYEQVALSSTNGDGNIYVGSGSGINSLHANPTRGDEEQIAVIKATAADFCRVHNIQRVQLIKCDTEGHDMEVIRGALPMMVDGSISILQFEYNYRWVFSRNYLRDAFIAIENLPYKVAKLQSDHIFIFSEWHPELEKYFEGNYAIIHIDALGWFPSKRVNWDTYNTMHVEDQ